MAPAAGLAAAGATVAAPAGFVAAGAGVDGALQAARASPVAEITEAPKNFRLVTPRLLFTFTLLYFGVGLRFKFEHPIGTIKIPS